MRSTIHLVSAADYWPLAVAVREARRRGWLRAGEATRRRRWRPRRERLRAALAGRRDAAAQADRRSCSASPPRAASASGSTSSAHRRRARGSAAAPTSTRSPRTGSGPPRSTATRPSSTSSAATSAVRPRHRRGRRVVHRAAGARARAALERLDLRRFRAEDGEELLDLPRAPLPDPDTPAPVRFLPTWDATLLVHARRTGVLPEEHRPRIFHTKAPQSFPTFLVDGAVAGTWRYEQGGIELDAVRPPRRRRPARARGGGRAPRRLPRLAGAGYVPNMLDVRRLRVLREVARRGSLAGAADVLSYTPSPSRSRSRSSSARPGRACSSDGRAAWS